MIKIQRWSPDTCGCVIEQQVNYDDPEPSAEFLMMNKVCEKHSHLISPQKKPNHAILSANVLSLIEQAKAVNLKQVDDQIAKATRSLEKKDLQKTRQLVVEFNARLDEEWGELVTFTHAFDSHIHDQVRIENKNKIGP